MSILTVMYAVFLEEAKDWQNFIHILLLFTSLSLILFFLTLLHTDSRELLISMRLNSIVFTALRFSFYC